MADPNVETLRPVYEEWGRGEWSRPFDFRAPDFEWGWSDEMPGGDLPRPSPDPDVLAGGPSRRLRAWLSAWENWHCEAEEYLVSGDDVVVLCRYYGRAKISGVPVDVLGAHFWTFRDGEAVRLEIFSSRERALAAAGLS